MFILKPFTVYFSVFDWVRRKRVSMFNNGNPFGTYISSLCCVNQDVGGLLMIGSCKLINIFKRQFRKVN